MKRAIKNMPVIAALAGFMLLFLSSCVEGRYYNHYHHHTREWYDHRHMPPPAGVDFNVDVRNW